MDGRSGSSSMRLNFAGVPDDDIREGVRRIGRAVREQVGLLGTLTGSPPSKDVSPSRGAAASRGASERTLPAEDETGLADVVALPRREPDGSARQRRDR